MIQVMTLRVKIANVREETPLYTQLASLNSSLRRFPLAEETFRRSGIKTLCVLDVPIERGQFTDRIISGILSTVPKRGRMLAYFAAGTIPRDRDQCIFGLLAASKAPDRTAIRIAYPAGKDEETRVLEALFVATQGRGVEKRKLRRSHSKFMRGYDEFSAPVRLGKSLANLVEVTLHRVPGVHVIIAR